MSSHPVQRLAQFVRTRRQQHRYMNKQHRLAVAVKRCNQISCSRLTHMIRRNSPPIPRPLLSDSVTSSPPTPPQARSVYGYRVRLMVFGPLSRSRPCGQRHLNYALTTSFRPSSVLPAIGEDGNLNVPSLLIRETCRCGSNHRTFTVIMRDRSPSAEISRGAECYTTASDLPERFNLHVTASRVLHRGPFSLLTPGQYSSPLVEVRCTGRKSAPLTSCALRREHSLQRRPKL